MGTIKKMVGTPMTQQDWAEIDAKQKKIMEESLKRAKPYPKAKIGKPTKWDNPTAAAKKSADKKPAKKTTTKKK